MPPNRSLQRRFSVPTDGRRHGGDKLDRVISVPVPGPLKKRLTALVQSYDLSLPAALRALAFGLVGHRAPRAVVMRLPHPPRRGAAGPRIQVRVTSDDFRAIDQAVTAAGGWKSPVMLGLAMAWDQMARAGQAVHPFDVAETVVPLSE